MTGAGQGAEKPDARGGRCACEWSGDALKVVCIAHLEAVREFDGQKAKPAESFRVFCTTHDKHDARYHNDRPMLDDRCPACVNAALLREVEGLKAALEDADAARIRFLDVVRHVECDLTHEGSVSSDTLEKIKAALSPASNTACATCGHEADHHSKDCGSDCHHAECYVTGCSCRRYVAALSPASGAE